jgi:hypothetical protein
MKKQLKTDDVVSIIENAENENDLIFLIKEDGSCEKKRLEKLKNFVCHDNKKKKTDLCEKH